MEFTNSLKTLFMETARSLTGSARRLFMARTVKELGPGGQHGAPRNGTGWSRVTIRKGTHELDSGFTCLDALHRPGSGSPVEALLAHLVGRYESQSSIARVRRTAVSHDPALCPSGAESDANSSPRKVTLMPRSPRYSP